MAMDVLRLGLILWTTIGYGHRFHVAVLEFRRIFPGSCPQLKFSMVVLWLTFFFASSDGGGPVVTLSLTMPGGMPVFPSSTLQFLYGGGYWSDMPVRFRNLLMGDNRVLHSRGFDLLYLCCGSTSCYIMAEWECECCTNEGHQQMFFRPIVTLFEWLILFCVSCPFFVSWCRVFD